MIEHTLRFTLPAAFALLPGPMGTPPASAMLLAIGLQESKFRARRQWEMGPARGFWQFERIAVAEVLRHPLTQLPVAKALEGLCYSRALGDVGICYALLEDNDTLAAIFARLLLWRLPTALPAKQATAAAWGQYLEAWRPGRERPTTWPANYVEAWARVIQSAPAFVV